MPTRKRNTRNTIHGFAATKSSRGVMRQAADDLERGQKNTDCRLPDGSSEKACPTPRRRR
jgi:hypothetical protein